MVKPPESAFAITQPAMRSDKPVKGSIVWWLRFLGLLAFVILLWRLPGAQDVKLERIDLRWIGLCMLLTVSQLLLEAFAWQWLLSMQRIRHPYPKTLVAYLASQYLGLVTPGHVGEVLAAGYISMNTGITFGYALSSVVMKKILGWTTVVGFGIWGLPLLAEISILQGVRWVIAASLIALVALSAGIGLWVFSIRRLARKWRRLSPWQIDLTEFWSGIRHLASVKLAAPLGIAALAFSVLFFQYDAVLRAQGVALPFVFVAQMVAFSRIIQRVLIPVSVVGVGSKDAAIALLLAGQGIGPAVWVATTLLFLISSYLVTLLVSGLCWWVRPLVVRRAARTTSSDSG